jgi:hypothetical protein
MVTTLVASATFLVVAVGANRQTPPRSSDLHSGTGGFALLAESSAALFGDPVAEAKALGADAAALAGVRAYSMRVRDGDDASCLNPYQALEPKILGVGRDFIERGGFAFGATLAVTAAEKANPWLLLDRREPGGAVPVIGDTNTVQWLLHKGVGDTLAVGGQTLRIVALLDGSVYQSALLMSDSRFIESFPTISGWRAFALTVGATGPPAPPPTAVGAASAAGGGKPASPGRSGGAISSAGAGGRASLGEAARPALSTVSTSSTASTATAAQALEAALEDSGFDAVRADEKLAQLMSVENTYLQTFQSLGGLGLLLGTVGLALALARNLLERRRELALLRALGFRARALVWMTVAENLVLLVVGVGSGALCAVAALAPAAAASTAAAPWGALALLLVGIVAVGALASALSAALVVRLPMLESLKQERA